MKIFRSRSPEVKVFSDQLKFFRFGNQLINISAIASLKTLSLNPTVIEVNLLNGQVINLQGDAADDLEGVLADYTIYTSKGN